MPRLPLPAHYIHVVDPSFPKGLLTAIENHLPKDWGFTDVLANATVILTQDLNVDLHLQQEATNLAAVAKLATGQARVANFGVPVIELPNTALIGVAEHTVMLILALSRQLLPVTKQTLKRRWVPSDLQPQLTDQKKYTYNWIGLKDFGNIFRKTVGIVGLGYIGRAVAERLKPFGVKLIYHQRTRLDEKEEQRYGVEWRSLEALLREADIVTLHHRFQEGPEGNDKQFDRFAFENMKKGALFINTARGRLVDEEAMVEALQRGHLRGVGLDVFRFEPLPEEHPLWAYAQDKAIITPHVAGSPLGEAFDTAARVLVERLYQISNVRTES